MVKSKIMLQALKMDAPHLNDIPNCSVRGRARVVAWPWPEPEPLLSNGPRHIGYRRKAGVTAETTLVPYRGLNVGIKEKR
jgi:hypothetical protein